jgi:leucyl aminopeptidase
MLCNYENSHKKIPDPSEKKEDEEDLAEKDPRTLRINKRIDELKLVVEDSGVLASEANTFERVCAGATILARDLANTRGSVGTPCFMEEEVMKVAKGKKGVKEIRVLDAAKLQEL